MIKYNDHLRCSSNKVRKNSTCFSLGLEILAKQLNYEVETFTARDATGIL